MFFFTISISYSWGQCTPIDCASSLPPFGGLCDELLAEGLVNTAYSDNESFILTDNCFDAGEFDPDLAGTSIKITNVDNITFSNLPNGLTAAADQASYSPPSGAYVAGCAAFTGTPTEAGVFEASIDFVADVALCPFNIPVADQAAGFDIEITVLPDPSFSGLAASYCTTDGAVTLSPTGTTGGTFSGPGVSGNMFDPSAAGVGMHTITYSVTAQEGMAVSATSNSMDMAVTVSTPMAYYADTDDDTYGDPNNSIMACSPPAGYVSDNTDCDDTNDEINPGATDIPNNGIDEDCVGGDNTTVIDNDNDSFDSTVDCNDDNPDVYPGAPEVCNGKDDDCNGIIDDGLTEYTYYADTDEDGFGDANSIITDCSETPPMGYVANMDDCDDTTASINPNAPESCDGIDNNCNGIPDDVPEPFVYYADLDNDGYTDNSNIIDTCATSAPTGYTSSPSQMTDCDDNNPNINPGMNETCDGIDNNCSGEADDGLTQNTYYADTDNDTFGDADNTTTTCDTSPPAGFVTDNTDCDDTNDEIYPGATETADNGIDEDCDGDDLTNVEDLATAFGIRISPNPASDLIYFHTEQNIEATIEIFSLLGQRTFSTHRTIENAFSIDLSQMESGMYFIKITDADKKVGIQKFIIK